MSSHLHNHLVFGAGLIGGFLGACLQSRGFEVALVARPKLAARYAQPMHCTDLEGHALTLDGIDCVESASDLGQPADVIWLTVKCTAVQSALKDMQPFVGPNTLILCCQNGLGADRAVRDYFPGHVVLRVMVPFNVVDLNAQAQASEGFHLHRGTAGELILEDHPAILELASKLHSSLMPVACSHDMEAALWAKLQLNLANPINALTDIPLKTMLEDRTHRLRLAAAMQELLAVTEAANLVLPKLTSIPARWLPKLLSTPNWLFKRVAQKMLAMDPEARLSMWWDIHSGKRTEIEYLNGAVVSTGKMLGIDCPVNQQLVDDIHKLEQR